MIVALVYYQQLFGGPYSKNIEPKNNFPNGPSMMSLLGINKLIQLDIKNVLIPYLKLVGKIKEGCWFL
jgi:hypothetical protein